ncbi:MAG TPA: CRTAC1 family protein [Vicinamibacteria bacterium]|nr:CRTAC1 family protein [Vicinamibacteria bacterium]
MARAPWILLALAASPSGEIRFEDVTASRGIAFVHYNAATEEKYMVETMGSGGGFFDFDLDSDLDVYLVNGAPLPGAAKTSEPPRNALYRNDGGRFEDVTEKAGVAGKGFGMGMSAGDVDNDGDLDLYVTNFGPNIFYRNRGDGTFEDGTKEAGLEAGGWSTSAAFADYDADGSLDLYVARYVDFALDNHKFCGNQAKNIKAYCHPDVYDPVSGILFRGRGDGTFEDVTREAGVYVEDEGKGLGVVWGDYDNDADVDLYVANDSMRSFLFRNEGRGRFTDVTLLSGVGYSEDGKTQAGMGTDMGDYDGDGFLDITKTNLDFEYNSMYRGGALGIFSDESYESGVAEVSLNFVGFGTFFFDFDNDGLLDVFVANGHIIDNIHLFNSASTYREPNFLFENQGGGVFREIGASVGDALSRENVARGAAPGDFDSDGDLDILVTRCGEGALLLENQGGSRMASLSVALVARTSNRDALGARATLRSGQAVAIREVKSGLSYLSQGSLELHFGLGSRREVDVLEIRWPGGETEIVERPGPGRIVVLEGAGRLIGRF